MIKIVDSKKLEMTQDEFDMYLNICKSYTRQNFDGKDMFKNLFESDDNGIIMFLKPPTSQYSSMEVYLYLMSLMQHQHLRLMYDKVQELCNEMRNKFDLLKKEKGI